MHWPLKLFIVADASMLPTLQPGHRLLVARCLPARRGDIVVVRNPELGVRFLVKRVVSVDGTTCTLIGDNTGSSRDSRAFGPIGRASIVGRVVWRYLPSSRRGRIGPV